MAIEESRLRVLWNVALLANAINSASLIKTS